jgi:hypothetical protein
MISTLTNDRYKTWRIEWRGPMPEYKCKTWPNGARQHYWVWGDPAKPSATEPEPTAVCVCGETTWAAEKAKQTVSA